MKLRSLREIKDLKGKRVLLRADLNVPIKKLEVRDRKLEVKSQKLKVRIADDFKIKKSLKTIEYLVKNKAKVILISHLGRPKGRVVKDLRLKPVYELLKTKYKLLISYCPESIDGIAESLPSLYLGQALAEAKGAFCNDRQEIILLENLRFHSGEEANDPKFTKELASMADFFVNDAFACCHREHASIVGLPKYLPSYAGLNLEKEVESLSKLTENSEHPLVVVLGGAKMFTKIGVIENFKKIADWILIGGALANNFLKAEGYEVGKSLIEKDKIKEAERLLENSNFGQGNYNQSFCADDCCIIGGEKIILPCDVKTIVQGLRGYPSCTVSPGAPGPGLVKIKKISQIKKTDKILDIGPATIKLFSEILSSAKTIFWNGPMGFFEEPNFALGTQKIVEAILKSRAQVIIGGGETVSVIHDKQLAVSDKRIFISTGGGAMLEFLAEKELPGLKALKHESI
jgi:phosphoglycerate kinase